MSYTAPAPSLSKLHLTKPVHFLDAMSSSWPFFSWMLNPGSVDGTRFDVAGAQILGESIGGGNLASLNTLQLSQNAIGDTGVMKLLVSLGGHPGLTELNLNYCEISDAGAPALGALACALESLSTLRLSYNRITEDGFDLLCQWLKVGSRTVGEGGCEPRSSPRASGLRRGGGCEPRGGFGGSQP